MSSWKVKSKTTVHKTTVNSKTCVYLFYRNAAALDILYTDDLLLAKDETQGWGEDGVL